MCVHSVRRVERCGCDSRALQKRRRRARSSPSAAALQTGIQSYMECGGRGEVRAGDTAFLQGLTWTTMCVHSVRRVRRVRRVEGCGCDSRALQKRRRRPRSSPSAAALQIVNRYQVSRIGPDAQRKWPRVRFPPPCRNAVHSPMMRTPRGSPRTAESS